MRALGAIQPAHSISAMQSINIAVINPWFLTPFFGVAALCLLLVIAAVLRWQEPGTAYVLAGGLLYVVGTLLVTMLFNVPRNNALAALAATSPEGAAQWTDYLIVWTKWNHVRTIAALAGAVSFMIALTR
ncbi:DUF1772 domain-containing protein [Pararobbsia alpina]|uniref:DUF1772 domain-containing protein n=1 Tax=Pararobbsia alpina TaxID=621374 RepID=A0A6S7B8X9_9BURK|nr:anthrone oxygenase family protein [Pararobbsia alpina]CAB3781292.1 hypothetical protein LMG28138_01165 [Pararobbsia alpina]